MTRYHTWLRLLVLLSATTTLAGCAFRTQVQRFGVEYNEALSSMANEQTLLNILRTSKGMPTHFSSVSRFTGSLSVKASGSANGQLKGSGLTRTTTNGSTLSTATTTGTSAAPGGLTTNNSVVTTPATAASVVDALAEGVDMYTPQIGGELNSGTTFDVQVFDQQKFYQGILSSVKFSTVEMFINQGFEPDLIANLLIARVDFYREDPKVKGKKTGDPVASYRNDARDRLRFQQLIDCNELDSASFRAPETKIAPISRIDLGTIAGKNKLTLEQLALLDGEKLALSDSGGISADGSNDATNFIVKPGAASRIPHLVGRSCKAAVSDDIPPEGVYLNDGTALVLGTVGGMSTPVKTPVVMEVVFRSPEAVLRAVGEMVRLQGTDKLPRLALCPDGGTQCAGANKHYAQIFEITPKHERKALLTAQFMGTEYSIPESSIRSMQVVSIIQQLINLQKESSENAVSIPVRAVP